MRYIDATTRYSPIIRGDAGNYTQYARYDITAGYIGISVWGDKGGPVDRILLTPHQVEQLIAFVRG
jgi:hypothetical protein